MIGSDIIKSLTEEELGLLFYILEEKFGPILWELNENTLKCYKYDKLAEKIFSARELLKTEDNEEGIKIYNNLCNKFEIEKFNQKT